MECDLCDNPPAYRCFECSAAALVRLSWIEYLELQEQSPMKEIVCENFETFGKCC